MFQISYSESLEEQRKIAAEFKHASKPGFSNCTEAINGILIWMFTHSKKEAKKVGVDKKILCRHKHKFSRLNCQAVSDYCGRFIDISIN